SLNLSTDSSYNMQICALGSNQPLKMEKNPLATYQRIFMDLSGARTDAEFAKLRTQRKSVIDLLRTHLLRVQSSVGAADRVKLQAHLEAVSGIERDIATLGVLKCQAPAVPAERPAGADHVFQGGRLQTDLL